MLVDAHSARSDFRNSRSLPRPLLPRQLSLRLKQATAAAHGDIDERMNLPVRLRSLAAYADCLRDFAAILAPIEKAFGDFHEWESFGVDIARRMRLPALHADLAALDVVSPPGVVRPLGLAPGLGTGLAKGRAPFGSFAHALGGLYVTEGATLGGPSIAQAVVESLGAPAAGATTFFQGHGAENGRMWNQLRAALDGFGERHPERRAAVIRGARAVFRRFAAGLRVAAP